MAQRFDICLEIHRELKHRRNQSFAYIFYEPVAKLGLPDYDQIVKHPMDLSTIKKKLDTNAYKNTQEFVDDIKLMISNCHLYNPPENDIIGLAKQFEKLVDELLEKLEVADEEEHVVDSTQLDYEEAPMARRDMLKLRNEIIALPDDKLLCVVNILKKHEPKLVPPNAEEVDIDFSDIGIETMHKLKKYIDTTKKS